MNGKWKGLMAWALAAIVAAALPAHCASNQEQIGDGKHHWLFPHHPRARRITKALGFGAATGGVLAPVLGVGVLAGATAGAAEHGAVRGVKDKHDLKKHKKLDTHIW